MNSEEARIFSEAMQTMADTAAMRAALNLKMAVIVFTAEMARSLVAKGSLRPEDISAVCDAVCRRAEGVAADIPGAASDMSDIAASVRLEIVGRSDGATLK